METRTGKVLISAAGGSAAPGAKTCKVSLPNTWVRDLGIDLQNRSVLLSFDGEKITIAPRQSVSEFETSRLARGHKLLWINYYDGGTLCTSLCADYTEREVCVENFTGDWIKTAFGKKTAPSWKDFEDFLESRCIPQSRAGLREYLEALGLAEYDPLSILRVTKGRMAEDNQWLEVRDVHRVCDGR